MALTILLFKRWVIRKKDLVIKFIDKMGARDRNYGRDGREASCARHQGMILSVLPVAK